MPRTSKSKSKGIVTWPEGERPRERLLRLGAQSLTDAELLARVLLDATEFNKAGGNSPKRPRLRK